MCRNRISLSPLTIRSRSSPYLQVLATFLQTKYHAPPLVKHVYTRLLTDDELTAHLDRGDSITFEGPAREWQQIERQVERLGFGDQYAVSRTRRPGATGEHAVTRVTPIRGQPQV